MHITCIWWTSLASSGGHALNDQMRLTLSHLSCLKQALFDATFFPLCMRTVLLVLATLPTVFSEYSAKYLCFRWSGLYPLLSLVNHACCPNSTHYFVEEAAMLRAGQDLRAGEILAKCTEASFCSQCIWSAFTNTSAVFGGWLQTSHWRCCLTVAL